MTNRREFLHGASLTAVPLLAGLPAIAVAVARSTPAFHAVLIDDRYAAASLFGARLAARGETLRVVPGGNLTYLWLNEIAPAWRRKPVPVAGLTRPAVLFCLEQLAWAQGLRVVFHAEHVVTPTGAVQHTVQRCAEAGLALDAGSLALRGPLWPSQVADVVASHGALPRHAAAGPSCSGLAPELAADAELLASWIIAPA